MTLPCFIPVPMGLGTFGAFIQIRGAIPDRRKLFDVGLNELPESGWGRRAIGALAFVLLFLIMAPVPHRFMTALGVLCPYL